MSDQEIIDAIDAEIAKTEARIKLSLGVFYSERMHRISGLWFARALIVKRMEREGL